MIPAINPIAAFIKSLRGENGWSQDELSDRLNVGRSSVGQWETGRAMPKEELLSKMAEMAGVEAEYLILLKQQVSLAKHGVTVPTTGTTLSSEEHRLITLWRNGELPEIVEFVMARLKSQNPRRPRKARRPSESKPLPPGE